MKMKMTFKEFLMAQLEEDTPIGDLARDAKDYDMNKYLMCDEAKAAYDEARRLWQNLS